MKRMIFFVLSLLVGTFFLLGSVSEARRAGGGKSFGGKQSYQQSAPKPADINPGQSQRGPGPLQQSRSPQPSRWGGLGGMLGGLLMGGLIGSLLFGGAGFAGPGLIDILVIGAILFFVVKLIRARTSAAPQPASVAPGGDLGVGGFPVGGGSLYDVQGKATVPPIPDGFDVDEFLRGAKAAFIRVQEAWSKRAIDDLKHFTSKAVLDELSRQAKEDPVPTPIEVLLVNASLSEVKDEGGERTASVFFDVLMREDPAQDQPSKVQEVWHFKKTIGDPSSLWVLDGIQQVE